MFKDKSKASWNNPNMSIIMTPEGLYSASFFEACNTTKVCLGILIVHPNHSLQGSQDPKLVRSNLNWQEDSLTSSHFLDRGCHSNALSSSDCFAVSLPLDSTKSLATKIRHELLPELRDQQLLSDHHDLFIYVLSLIRVSFRGINE